MRRFSALEIVMMMFATAMCIAVIEANTSWAVRGPDTIPEEARNYMKEVFTLIMGALIMWIGMVVKGRKDKENEG